VELAVSRGVQIMSLTDHDSTEGLPEALQAASRYPGFTLIPGVEMSTDIPRSEVHVLGYFLDPKDGHLQEELARLRGSRRDRGRRMVEKLRDLGVDISWERVQAIADGGAVGRPHVARALLEKGHVGSNQEAFDRYIGRNGPAYVERAKMTPAEAVAFVHQRRALPVLAHPREMEDLENLLPTLQEAGLAGMEVYYQDYDEASIERLLTIARRHGLLPTGGSDYHGLGGERERLPGDIPLPDEAIDAFMAVAERYAIHRV
jgi:predicted metal-dependent phosphoesterase TrpH